MNTPFHIPGAFEPHALTGVHPNVFRPPASPSASTSTYLPPSTPQQPADPPAKRKRDDTRENTPTRDGRYVLADTSGGAGGGGLDDSVYSDVAYRRQLGPREEGGETSGWRSAALGAIGGVVGKVWEFCKAGAFRGFYAGGGRGYPMDAGGKQEPRSEQVGMEDTHGFGVARPEDIARAAPEIGRLEETGRRFRMERPEDSPRFQRRPIDLDLAQTRPSPTQQSSKRRHLNDELGRNWVMVDDPTRRTTRRNRNSSPSVTTGRRINTPASRRSTSYKAPNPRRSHKAPSSHAGSPALSPREPASFAAQRSPSVLRSPTQQSFRSPPSRIPLSAGRTHHHHHHRQRANSTRASPTSIPRLHRKSASLTEPPSSSAPLAAATSKKESPRLDPEARKLAARREREERDADMQMAALNARLQDMIREGREALGTSFEVEGDGEGDGWMDE